MAVTSLGLLGSAGVSSLATPSGGGTDDLSFTTASALEIGDYIFWSYSYAAASSGFGISSLSIVIPNHNSWSGVTGVDHPTADRLSLQPAWIRVATAIAASSTFTQRLSAEGAKEYTEMCIYAWAVRPDSGSTLEPVTPNSSSTVTGANGFGSTTLTPASANHVYWKSCAKRSNSTTGITATTNFTSLGLTVRSRSSPAASLARGEFRINNSSSETSNPTLNVSADAVSVFTAFKEVLPVPRTHVKYRFGYRTSIFVP